MPLYEYQCPQCQVIKEEIRSYDERDDYEVCHCGNVYSRLPSNFYTTPERLYGEWHGHRTIINDSKDDPWEGGILEGRGAPNKATYKSKRIQLDISR